MRAWAAGVGGGVPRSTRDLSGGFSPGATTVLDCPGGAIFVKAVGAALNAESPEFHRREAVVSAALPPAPEFPRLLDVYDDGDWVALAFEAIDGGPPAHPWDRRQLEAAVQALDALHDALTPSPVPDAPAAADRLQFLFGGWAELAALDRPPEGLDTWSARHLDRLAELESGWREAVAGSTLLHGDVRSDNLLVTSGGVVFVDWPHACVGAPVFDLVAWAPSVELEGGPAPEELLALSRSGVRGRPRRRRGAGGRIRRVPGVALVAAGTARAPHAARVPGCAGRGGAGVARAPHRLVTPGAPWPASQ